MLDQKVIVYLDDILVYSKTKEEHFKDLEEVFRRLQQNRLITKGSKCEFLKPELELLGHVVSGEGIKIDPRKVDAIAKWNPPTNITELQSFLGFVNYVCRFVPNMAGVTKPLTDLLHKDTHFQWGEREQSAFDTLKYILSSPPVLRLADPSRPFEVITDASDFAVGAVLLQDFGKGLQPIAYESCKMQPPERNYPVHDKEMLAIVHAFRVWRCYLTGADVTIRLDHKSLQYLRSQPTLNPRQIRWLDYLESNFNYTVTYKKGANNIVDALTRPSMQTAVVLVARTKPILTRLFTHSYTTNRYQPLRELLTQEVHDSNLLTDMLTDVQRYVTTCPTCQAMKSSRQRPAGLMQPLEPPERPWQQVTMDFVMGLPASASGNGSVLVVVDRLTKMAHFAPC
ncbi:unnamed protein product [Closterium sp. NIES-53]